jgi:hypothetical protein
MKIRHRIRNKTATAIHSVADKFLTFTPIRSLIVFQPFLSTSIYSFSVRFSHQNLLHMSNPSHSYYMPRPSHRLELIILITLREEHKLWSSSVRPALIPSSLVRTLAHKSAKSAHIQNTCKIKSIFRWDFGISEQQTAVLSLHLVQGNVWYWRQTVPVFWYVDMWHVWRWVA